MESCAGAAFEPSDAKTSTAIRNRVSVMVVRPWERGRCFEIRFAGLLVSCIAGDSRDARFKLIGLEDFLPIRAEEDGLGVVDGALASLGEFPRRFVEDDGHVELLSTLDPVRSGKLERVVDAVLDGQWCPE